MKYRSAKYANAAPLKSKDWDYSAFNKINGQHPLKEANPNGYVAYQARKRHGGKVFYFNFALAKEMGLIAKNHPEIMTSELSKSILETFSIVIINEYDLKNNTPIPPEDIKPHTYMATRYLQLQHPTKKGKTSGDGRSVWNGTISHNGTHWDVSSYGTGATRLSPYTAITKRFAKTGSTTVAYGNGYACLDEGINGALMSEVFHHNGIETERGLALIAFDNGSSINVRASRNLLRPSHFFHYLKQGRRDDLKNVVDYFIERQVKNGLWPVVSTAKRYDFFAEQMAVNFSTLAARFENDYIFCWLDWDGDNVLASAGIIDYGSVRQFGLFHHEYRYDDVDRFSTNIAEQRIKARYIVQSFVQIAEFLKTGEKKAIAKFRNHPTLRQFDENFDDQILKCLLLQVGFNQKHTDYLFEHHTSTVKSFLASYRHFERTQAKRGVYKVADGITSDAVFCMRDILRELPRIYSQENSYIAPETFIEIMKSSYAKKRDLVMTSYRRRKIREFQMNYRKLATAVAQQFYQGREKQVLLELTMRSSIINRFDRITGDSTTLSADCIMRKRKQLDPESLYRIVQKFVNNQILRPENQRTSTAEVESCPEKERLLRRIFKIIQSWHEGI